jgi:hypothetical protein
VLTDPLPLPDPPDAEGDDDVSMIVVVEPPHPDRASAIRPSASVVRMGRRYPLQRRRSPGVDVTAGVAA